MLHGFVVLHKSNGPLLINRLPNYLKLARIFWFKSISKGHRLFQLSFTAFHCQSIGFVCQTCLESEVSSWPNLHELSTIKGQHRYSMARKSVLKWKRFCFHELITYKQTITRRCIWRKAQQWDAFRLYIYITKNAPKACPFQLDFYFLTTGSSAVIIEGERQKIATLGFLC